MNQGWTIIYSVECHTNILSSYQGFIYRFLGRRRFYIDSALDRLYFTRKVDFLFSSLWKIQDEFPF